jgi:hypothetical protein
MKKKHLFIFAAVLFVWSIAEYALLELHHQSSIHGVELLRRMDNHEDSAYGWWVEDENEIFYWVRYAPGSRYYCLIPQLECELFRVRKSEIRIEVPDERKASGNIKEKDVALLKNSGIK